MYSRDFYRKCKEDIDFYLNTLDEENYHFIYQLVGPPMAKFQTFEGEEAKGLLNAIRKYFIDKMNQLS